MPKIKKVVAALIAICSVVALCSIGALAVEEPSYPVEITVMTTENRNAYETQTEYVPTVGTAYLAQNNESGTNGSICAPFTAETTHMAFVLTSAPGAMNYNIQLYEGIPGEGERISDYATVDVNNGVYFSGLTVGQDYYIKLSSNTLQTSGCTAVYSMIMY